MSSSIKITEDKSFSNSAKKTLLFDKVLREELLAWVNTTLQSKFNKIEELCTGAAYCQLLHAIFPTAISIKRVKFITNLEHECFENFKILQRAFDKLGIKRSVPVARLCKGKYQENLEFLAWFRKFYMANDNMRNRYYDPLAMRNGMPMKYGPVEVRNIYEKRAKDAMKAKISLQQTKLSISQRTLEKSQNDVTKTTTKFRPSTLSLERSATKTLMKHRRSTSGAESRKTHNSADAISTASSRASSKTNSTKCSTNVEANAGGDGRYALQSDRHSQTSANSDSISLKRSVTRTLIKANKAIDDIEGVQYPSPVSSEHTEIVHDRKGAARHQKIATENEIVMLKNKLIDVERMLEQKSRIAYELELELAKTQTEVNEMQVNLRRARQERDNYFDKIRRVTMCCRNAQCNAELAISVSEVMKIFLSDSNLL